MNVEKVVCEHQQNQPGDSGELRQTQVDSALEDLSRIEKGNQEVDNNNITKSRSWSQYKKSRIEEKNDTRIAEEAEEMTDVASKMQDARPQEEKQVAQATKATEPPPATWLRGEMDRLRVEMSTGCEFPNCECEPSDVLTHCSVCTNKFHRGCCVSYSEAHTLSSEFEEEVFFNKCFNCMKHDILPSEDLMHNTSPQGHDDEKEHAHEVERAKVTPAWKTRSARSKNGASQRGDPSTPPRTPAKLATSSSCPRQKRLDEASSPFDKHARKRQQPQVLDGCKNPRKNKKADNLEEEKFEEEKERSKFLKTYSIEKDALLVRGSSDTDQLE